ncbi:MFS transporter [Diaminobutyricimonas sp. LJ205]|uniref:MFS transporter n=1 Tax=Diaminobutyricimonas sp. LJ205 TaxID=2683590 RepID=UPI0012F49047|nr:MFS transporter [Diaminobutyricimonas sp. LJ205]
MLFRILPLLMLGSMINYLDRVNLGFAALQMNEALALTATAFGIAASLGVIAYCIFEVPSNLILQKVGSRVWLARILITWGIVSALTAFAFNDVSLFIIRFVLGAMEAGYSPGAIVLIALWIPRSHRGLALGLFLMAQSFAVLLGAPVSGWILDAFNGVSDLGGWQWMFILEGLPAVILGVLFLMFLRDKPSDARWLTSDELTALTARLAEDEKDQPTLPHARVGELLKLTFSNKTVLKLSGVYFGLTLSAYAIAFFLPTIVADFGFSASMTGWIMALPPLAALMTMLIWSRISDKSSRRERVASVGFIGLTVCLIGMVVLDGPVWLIVAVVLGQVCLSGALVAFWPIPTIVLAPALRPAGVAVANSLGTLGGAVSPIVFGLVRDATGSYDFAILFLALFALTSALLVLTVRTAKRTNNVNVETKIGASND